MQISALATDLGFTEGPVWLPDQRIALTSISHGCLYVVDPAGGPVERIVTGGGPNGLALGPDGYLYVAQNGGIFGGSGPAPPGVQIVGVDSGGKVDYFATGMDAPNDLIFGPDGRLWVTDPRGETVYTTAEPGWLWACGLDGTQPERIVDKGPVFINGLGFSGDGRTLFVSATLSSELLAYDTSTWAPAGVVHTMDNGWPDGLVISPSGQLWVATTGGDRIDVIDPSGTRSAVIDLPAGSLPTNVCIGGPELDELYVTAAGTQSLLRIRFGDGEPSLRG